MELDAVHPERAVAHGHHLAVAGRGRDLELLGDRGRRERVVAPGLEVIGQTGEETAPVVVDDACLAVQQLLRLPDLAAERLDDGLVAEADAERRGRRRKGPGEMTRCDGASRSASSTPISSFRRTSTSAPSSWKRCTRLYVNES